LKLYLLLGVAAVEQTVLQVVVVVLVVLEPFLPFQFVVELL